MSEPDETEALRTWLYVRGVSERAHRVVDKWSAYVRVGYCLRWSVAWSLGMSRWVVTPS